MASKPKKEREKIEIGDETVRLLKLLELNSWVGKVASPTKDALMLEICNTIGVPYKDDGPYDKIYEGERAGIKMELTSWQSVQVPWKQRYEELLKMVLDALKEHANEGSTQVSVDEVIAAVLVADRRIKEKIVGKPIFKPKISIEGVNLSEVGKESAVELVDNYWLDLEPKE